MPLADDIHAVRDRVLADVNAAHDSYHDTKVAWGFVENAIAVGKQFAIRKLSTGTVTTQTELVTKARGYVGEQLSKATFQQFFSIFEANHHREIWELLRKVAV